MLTRMKSLTLQSEAKKGKTAHKATTDDEGIQQTINGLSNQVNRLNDKLSQMQEQIRR